MSAWILPALLTVAALSVLLRGKPLFSSLADGIGEGLQTLLRIFPPVAATLTAAAMFRVSGALEALTALLRPLLQWLKLPPETAGLLLLRPLSGSGALAMAAELLTAAGPDSRTGRIAAVMLCGTETTLYVAGVYFGAAGVKHSRHALPAALLAEWTGLLLSGLAVDLLLS